MKGYKQFINENLLSDIKIEKIEKKDIHEIIHMSSVIFSHVMSYKNNVKYISNVTDFDKSVKLTNDGDIIGCYLVNDIELEEFRDKKGIEGIAICVKPEYRNYGLGEKLKDWLEEYAEDNDYDFIFGELLKGLKNLKQWLKRMDLYKEDDHSYYIIKHLK